MKLAIIMMVVVADMFSMAAPVPDKAPDPPVVVVEAPTEAPTTPIVIPTVAPTAQGTIYSIYGITPPEEWQRYLYAELEARGYAWYMPYAVCQIFQESGRIYLESLRTTSCLRRDDVPVFSADGERGVGVVTLLLRQRRVRRKVCVGCDVPLVGFGGGEMSDKVFMLIAYIGIVLVFIGVVGGMIWGN